MKHDLYIAKADLCIVVILFIGLLTMSCIPLALIVRANAEEVAPTLETLSEPRRASVEPEMKEDFYLCVAIKKPRQEASMRPTEPIYEEETEETPEEPVVNDVRWNEAAIREKYKKEIPYIAKCVWGEYRGYYDKEMAAVVWCILNRVDSEARYFPDDIISVIKQDGQFHGYKKSHPVEEGIVDMVVDVLLRWELEKDGVKDVGRVLPKDYCWFWGDSRHNYFRNAYKGGDKWDWTLPDPYAATRSPL